MGFLDSETIERRWSQILQAHTQSRLFLVGEEDLAESGVNID